jgi:hypothetical protein
MEQLLLTTSNSMEFEMGLILIFGIHILTTLFRYTNHYILHSYIYYITTHFLIYYLLGVVSLWLECISSYVFLLFYRKTAHVLAHI